MSLYPCSALAHSGNFSVSVLTRDPKSAKSQALLSEFPSINLLAGSYTTEAGLRTAFANQDATYFNIDSFNVGEPFEYFWTFRAYEIAVQSGLKLFIYAGAPDRFGAYGMAEKFRNSHNIVGSRLSAWLAAQPLDRMSWAIVTGGVYVEMLNTLLRPVQRGDGYAFTVPMDKDSVIPLIPLANYGERVRWILDHPNESIGKYLPAGAYQVTFPQIADAVQEVTGRRVDFVPISTEDWMIGASNFVDVEKRLPNGATAEDTSSFTFRKSFGAWWNIWEDNRAVVEDTKWADEEYAARPKTLQDWLKSVGYDPALTPKNVSYNGDATK